MRIPDDILRSVCFLCTIDRHNVPRYGATAFFVNVPSEVGPEGGRHVYLVTAQHCIEAAKQEGALHLRVNTEAGGARLVPIQDDWFYPENAASDIAILPVEDFEDDVQVVSLPSDMFLTDAVISDLIIGPGEDIVVTGLFTERHGNERNLPIVRTGVIASMPDETFVDSRSGLDYNAYLIEIRSTGGLSGSPVFAYLEPGRHKQHSASGSEHSWWGPTIVQRDQIYLLGLIRSHWVYEARGGPVEFTPSDAEQINMGIAMVTPIQEAMAVLKGDELSKRRKSARARR